MCGIAGLFLKKTRDIVSQKVTNMTRCMNHRGPDSDDQYGPNWSRAWALGVLGAWLNNHAKLTEA